MHNLATAYPPCDASNQILQNTGPRPQFSPRYRLCHRRPLLGCFPARFSTNLFWQRPPPALPSPCYTVTTCTVISVGSFADESSLYGYFSIPVLHTAYTKASKFTSDNKVPPLLAIKIPTRRRTSQLHPSRCIVSCVARTTLQTSSSAALFREASRTTCLRTTFSLNDPTISMSSCSSCGPPRIPPETPTPPPSPPSSHPVHPQSLFKEEFDTRTNRDLNHRDQVGLSLYRIEWLRPGLIDCVLDWLVCFLVVEHRGKNHDSTLVCVLAGRMVLVLESVPMRTKHLCNGSLRK